MPIPFEQLTARAQTIRDEQLEGANTAQRVGTLLADTINACATVQSATATAQSTADAAKTAARQATDTIGAEMTARQKADQKLDQRVNDAMTYAEEQVAALFVNYTVENKFKPFTPVAPAILSFDDNTPSDQIKTAIGTTFSKLDVDTFATARASNAYCDSAHCYSATQGYSVRLTVERVSFNETTGHRVVTLSWTEEDGRAIRLTIDHNTSADTYTARRTYPGSWQ